MHKKLKPITLPIWVLLLSHSIINQQTQANTTTLGTVETPNKKPFTTKSFAEQLQQGQANPNETLYLQEILQREEIDVLMITCPVKFGKGVDLNMVQTFLQLELTEDKKNIIPFRHTNAYNLFVNGHLPNGEKIQGGLDISTDKKIINNYLAQWPVINFSMKELNSRTPSELYEKFALLIRNLYKKYDYLKSFLTTILENPTKNSSITMNQAKTYIQQMEKYQNKNCSVNEYVDGIKILSEILFRRFQKKVFILTHRYDAPIINVHLSYRDETQKKTAKEYLVRFLRRTFKNNWVLKKGILISALPFARKDLLGGMRSAVEYMLAGRHGFFKIVRRQIEKFERRRKKTDKTGTITRMRKAVKTTNTL